jgi:hypothetical protein
MRRLPDLDPVWSVGFVSRKTENPIPTLMSSLRLHRRIRNRLAEFHPDLHRYRLDNLAWLITGIHEAQHVHLSKIADYRAGNASLTSKIRQQRRFLANEAIEPMTLYRPMARRLLEQAAAAHERLRLLMDVVELPGNRQVLMLSLTYRRRALPLLWSVERRAGKTDADRQIALLNRLEPLLVGLFPDKTRPILVADGEFHSVALIEHLDAIGWGFCLRLPSSTYVHLPDGRLCPLSDLELAQGERAYLDGVYLTAEQAYGPISIAAYWGAGEEAPWFIVTDEKEASYLTLRTYSRRMWTEELFGDLQGGGLHVHRSRVYEPERFSRLLVAACLVYLWLMHVGAYVIKRGWRNLVDRADRRDRSVVEIGRHWVRRQCLHEQVPRVHFAPYF